MYNIGFRKAALLFYDFFKSLRKVSKIFKIRISTLSRWNSSIVIKKRIRKSIQTSEVLRSFISLLIIQNPCANCTFLRMEINKHFGFNISRQLVHLIVQKCNFTFKRIRTRGTSKAKESKTKEFIASFREIDLDNTTIVSIDESGFDQRAHQVYGYSLKGHPAILTAPYCKDRKRYNLLLAISSCGKKYFKIYTQSITSEIYSNFINELPFPKQSVLLMDNARFHKTQLVHESINNKEFNVLYTPPYSPEYNPIELVFGQIKQSFYKMRFSIEENIGSLVHEITSSVTQSAIVNSFTHVVKSEIRKNDLHTI